MGNQIDNSRKMINWKPQLQARECTLAYVENLR